ncbi:hypothetical protein J2T09_001439 [Neorhizobium huautlense]|uniref:Bartonella effector protein BID domain-containing protein n=1 Tax=Neorhizobium huautlense TaxID=67774 RepID=A0ABT9PSI4_9HYPH|nr:hypothetical protein [Neorhizobium huautlense]
MTMTQSRRDNEERQPVKRLGATPLDAPGRDHLRRLPTEMHAEIASHMVTDNARETARNISAFRRVSRQLDGSADKSVTVRDAEDRIKQLRSFANDLHAAVVKQHLPDTEWLTYGVPRDEAPVPAMNYIKAIGPILKLRSADENARLADKILAIPDSEVRGEAIGAMVPHFRDITKRDRSRLIDDVIKTLGDRGDPVQHSDSDIFAARSNPPNTAAHYQAADVFVEAKLDGHLTQKHLADQHKLTMSRPGIGELLADREKVLLSSIAGKLQRFGPDVTAAAALQSGYPTRIAVTGAMLTRHFHDMDPAIRAGLITSAIRTVRKAAAPFQGDGAVAAVAVITAARAQGYLSDSQVRRLERFGALRPELAEVLRVAADDHERHSVKQASRAEIAKLRATLDGVRADVALPEPDRHPAEHQRMASLGKIAESVGKSATGLRQDVADMQRDRSGRTRDGR